MKKSIYYDRSKGRYCERWRENGICKCTYLPEGIDYSKVRKLRKKNANGILWEQWLEKDLEYYSNVARSSSLEKLELVYKRITEMFNPSYLIEISYEMIYEYRNRRLKQKVAPSTINTELAVIKAFLYRALDFGYITENPAASWYAKAPRNKITRGDLKLPVDQMPVRIISREDFAKLLAACPTDDWRLLISLGYYAGLRIGEILALRPEDVNLESRRISIYSYSDKKWRTKTGKGREVHIFDHLYNILSKADLSGQYVVRDISAKGKMTSRSVQQASARFSIICCNAGLTDNRGIRLYTLHILRKSCISNWKRAGLDLQLIQKMAGHSSIGTTLRHYVVPLTDDEFREIIYRAELEEMGHAVPPRKIDWHLL